MNYVAIVLKAYAKKLLPGWSVGVTIEPLELDPNRHVFLHRKETKEAHIILSGAGDSGHLDLLKCWIWDNIFWERLIP